MSYAKNLCGPLIMACLMMSSIAMAGERPCGFEGSVQERIKNCDEESRGFALVSRTRKGLEVHKDLSSGLLWSDRLGNNMSHYKAQEACQSGLKEMAGITGKNWRLPLNEEYEEAERNGIRSVLPNMHFLFWSSSVPLNIPDVAKLFNGGLGYTYNDYQYENFSVRCVAL